MLSHLTPFINTDNKIREQTELDLETFSKLVLILLP